MEKIKRPIRRSLILATVILLLLLSVLMAIAGSEIYRERMIGHYQNYAADTVDFLVRSIDGDDLEQCIETGEKTEKYHQLQALADHLKESHDLEFIYIIKPLKIDPPGNMMDVLAACTKYEREFEADELTDLGVISDYLYPAEVAKEYMARMDKDPTVTFFRNDTDFGRIYTAIRPVFNSRGEPIAVVCGDIEISEIYAVTTNFMLFAFALTLVFSLAALIIMNIWFGRRIVGPLGRVKKAAEGFVEKCKNRADVSQLTMEDPNIHTGDEIEALSQSIVQLGRNVQVYAANLLEKEREISNMKQYVEQLDTMAYRDALTGAGNKAAYDKSKLLLDQDILEGKARFGLVMADLNLLKRINDTYGHEKGNEYIKGMYRIISSVFKSSPIFRIGGDEFVVVVSDEELDNCEALLEQVRAKMKQISEDPDKAPWERISTAIGFARYEEGEDTDTVLRRADRAMYEEKQRMHMCRT